MKTIWNFIKRDTKHIVRNPIALVVCVGLMVVPCLYAWFNIAGSWDPYANTKNIRVALATDDEGYASELLPVRVNMGNEVISKLSESDAIGYEVTNSDQALEGVRSGKYYAAIVIPKNFSHDMLTSFTEPGEHADVLFYSNEKRNAIASIVTSKASTAAQTEIDQTFSSTVVEVGAGVLDQLGDYLSDDQVQNFAAKLEGALDSAQDQLTRSAHTTEGYQKLVRSAASLVGGSTQSTQTSLFATLDASGLLHKSAGGINELSSALDGAQDSIARAAEKSSANMQDVRAALDSVYSDADKAAGKTSDALASAKTAVDGHIQEVSALKQAFDQNTADLRDALATIEGLLDPQDSAYVVIHKVSASIDAIDQSIADALSDLTELSSQLDQASSNLGSSRQTAAQSKAALEGMVNDAAAKLAQVKSSYNADLAGSLPSLAAQVEELADQTNTITTNISDTVSSLKSTTDKTAQNLNELADALDGVATKTTQAADKIQSLQDSLAAARNSGDMAQVKAVLSANTQDLAAFVSQPVTLDRTAVFPVENNGSAMAPFYTTLAIWIGGVVLCALVKVSPSEAALAELKPKPYQSYLGRLVFFVLIGLMQASLIMLGDLFFLGVQATHPLLFLLSGWAASLVFINIIYALTAAFGDVGKAVAVLLMVIQVAGSGGTFPKQMLPAGFQAVYPWLPFVHAEGAFRAAMAGIYQGDIWRELLLLLAFIVPSLVLGLALRKPCIRMNEWFEEKLEQTHLM